MSEEFYSVLDEISCSSAVFDKFFCAVFRFLIGPYAPLCKMQKINKFNKKYATVIHVYATKPAVCVPGYNCWDKNI